LMRHGTINSGSLLTATDVRNAISVGGNLSYNASTGVINFSIPSTVLMGDVTGAGVSTVATTLSTTGVTSGSYGSTTVVGTFTVDSKGRLTAAGTAAIAFPVTSVAGRTGAVTIASADVTDATDVSTASKIVRRDASGNFAAGTITAALSGNASTATTATSASKLVTARTFSHNGDATGSASFDGSADVAIPLTLATVNTNTGTFGSSTTVATFTVDGKGRLTAAGSTAIAFPVTAVAGRTGSVVIASADISDATNTNTASVIVKRDASGNFAAGAITASLVGNSDTTTKLASARTIALTGAVAGSGTFDGSANLTIATISNLRTYTFYADQLDNPTSSDWSVNALAPATNDPTNGALVVRAFDDTAEEGVGFTLSVPANATNISFSFKGRPNTAPSSAQGVVLRLHRRLIPNNAAVSAWTITTLNTLSMPANIFYQYFTQTFTLSALGITAGSVVHFELTRNGAATADTLSGDFLMIETSLDFS
jgi:hypothetical protein